MGKVAGTKNRIVHVTALSSNGRITGFEPGNRGSNPRGATLRLAYLVMHYTVNVDNKVRFLVSPYWECIVNG